MQIGSSANLKHSQAGDDHLQNLNFQDDSGLYPPQFDPSAMQRIPSPTPSHHSASPIDIQYQGQEYRPSVSPNQFNYPGTPSYQGSFAGSMAGSPSPSHNWGGMDGQEDNMEDYNPSDYDVPDTGNSFYGGTDLSPFDIPTDEFDIIQAAPPSVSVVPADLISNHAGETGLTVDGESPESMLDDQRSPSPFRSRSRASSIASSHHGSPHMGHRAVANHLIDPSATWGVTAPSPPATAQSPPPTGSRSPPALLIPDTSANHLTPGGLFPPGANRSLGAGLNPGAPDGPGINLIPATPVSGGGNGATTAPFLQGFNSINAPKPAQAAADSTQRAGSSQNASSPRNPPVDLPMWPQQQPSDMSSMNVPSAPGSPSPNHLQQTFMGNHVSDPNSTNYGAVPSNPGSPFHRPSPSVSPHASPLPVTLDLAGTQPPSMGGGGGTAQLNVPYLKRERSKSETFSQRPAWALGVANYQAGNQQPFGGVQNQRHFDQNQTISSQPPESSTQASLDYMHPPPSADAYSNFYGSSAPHIQQVHSFGPPITNQSEYLNADDIYLNSDPMGIRRARSDAGSGHRRFTKSEDFSRSPDFTRSSLPDFSMGPGGLLAPPNHPSLMVPNDQFGRGRPLNDLTHHRRASSGSRSGHERGGSISGASSVRASPYPSPNASPMMGYAQLQPDLSSVDMHALNLHETPGTPPVNVVRPHVTTSATQAASATRRTSEATFTCPVPGCGSTFTRHFNLKGHMRSHNDERPFKCKWPGCEKGFARQHDCKRHEQLHLNIRPYTCEGCSRTFARMDALNRHLRSEGGAECAKHQQPMTEESAAAQMAAAQAAASAPKQEDQSWMPSVTRPAGTVLT